MAFNLKDLNFNVELKSSGAYSSRIPEGHTGIALIRPDEKIRKYKIKLWFSKETCEKGKMLPTGFCMARISDCSTAMQIIYEDQQGDNFKGYRLRPLGAYSNEDQIKKRQKELGSLYMNCYVELTVLFDELDTKKSNQFAQAFAENLHIAKNQVVIDISKLRLYVPTK